VNSKNICHTFLQKLPKAELHVHIEGTLEPQQLLLFAERNNITLPIKSILTDDKESYRYSDFASFIETYRASTQALCTQQDFYEMTMAYLEKVHQQGVVHTEIYFDLQTYAARAIHPDVIVYGIHKGLLEGYKRFNISGLMIFSLLCDQTEQQAQDSFNLIQKHYKDVISIIGLAAQEAYNAVMKFKDIFDLAHNEGYHCVAHAGEFGGPELIWQMLQTIPVERIDHGIGCVSDPALMNKLAERKIPLTICPVSNVMLHRCKNLQEHPIKKIYDAGVIVTINSDDPSYFKSYIGDNYRELLDADILSCKELVQCARNSINVSFMKEARKAMLLSMIDEDVMNHTCD